MSSEEEGSAAGCPAQGPAAEGQDLQRSKERPVQSRRVSRPLRLSILQAISWMLLFFPLFFLASIPGLLLGEVLDHPTRLLLANVLAWTALFLLVKRKAPEPWQQFFALRSFSPRLLPGIVLASVGLLFACGEVASWIPGAEWLEEIFEQALGGPYHWAGITAVVVIAPVAEELFFRGFVLRGFLSRYSIRKAALVSAALFAAVHLNPWQAILAFPIGIFSAWLYLRTGSIGPCILSHAIVNGTHLPLLIAIDLSGGDLDQVMLDEGDPWSSALFLLSGIALTVWGTRLLVRAFRSSSAQTLAVRDPAAKDS